MKDVITESVREGIEQYKHKLTLKLNKEFNKYLSKNFPLIEDLTLINHEWGKHSWSFSINNKKIKVQIDQYNNLYLEKCSKLEILELKTIHQLLVCYLEHKDSYKYRTGTSFLISYYKKYKPSKKFIREMFKVNYPIEDKEGFKEWLVEYANWKD